MSMNIMLQTESKRTLGGLLWLVFTLLSTFTLWVFVDSSLTPENLLGYISFYFTITSFIVVALITIRPEKWFNKRVIGKVDVPPFFRASEAPSIYDLADSAFIAKELDNFYGNWLVLIGFVVGIFFPLFKLAEMVIEVDILGIILIDGTKFIILSIFIILLYRKEIIMQKKDLREHIEIIWRYTSIIVHQGLESEYKSHIENLEDSIKIKHWEKAKQQINALNRIYSVSLNNLNTFLPDFHHAFQFILGQAESQKVYANFLFSENVQKHYFRLKILGLEHHNPKIEKIFDKLISDYNMLESIFRGHINKIKHQIEEYTILIQDDDILKPRKDHFVQLFNDMDLNLFHIENIHTKSDSFGKVYQQVSNSTTEQIKQLFKDVKNATELYHKLTKTERSVYKELTNKYQGTDPIKQVSYVIREILGWIPPQIVKVDKTLKPSLYSPLVFSGD